MRHERTRDVHDRNQPVESREDHHPCARNRRQDRADDAEADSILEARPSDATEDELKSYISDLNSDEQASLVAIMWIGRDTFAADDLDEAIETARHERSSPTEDYLLGIPLLSDYLTSGLEALGYNAEEYIDPHLK